MMPRHLFRLLWITLLAVVPLTVASCATAADGDHAADPDAPASTSAAASDTPAASDAADAPAAPAKTPDFKNMKVDMAKRYVDVEAVICLTKGPLEDFATVPSAKEYESVIALHARPSQIHLALLLLGLKAGSPGSWEYKDKQVIAHNATGSRLRLTLLYKDKDGKEVEKPATDFVRDMKSHKHPAKDIFVFAGSRVTKPQDGEPYYAADSSGDVVSLVTFPEEMIALPQAASSNNDQLEWEVDPDAVPPLGTKVTLRIYAVDPPAKKADAPKP